MICCCLTRLCSENDCTRYRLYRFRLISQAAIQPYEELRRQRGLLGVRRNCCPSNGDLLQQVLGNFSLIVHNALTCSSRPDLLVSHTICYRSGRVAAAIDMNRCVDEPSNIFVHLLQISCSICCEFHDCTLRRSGVYEPTLSHGRLGAAVAAAAIAGTAVESWISSWYDNIAVVLAAAGAAQLIIML